MKNLIITGVNKGLGYELTKVAIESNFRVFGIFRNPIHKNKLVDEFEDLFVPIIADITKSENIQYISSEISKYSDTIDCIINNAGISGINISIETITAEEMQQLFNVHCIGAMNVVKASLSFLRKSHDACIINITSRLGFLSKVASGEFNGHEVSYSYKIAKAAQNMLSICLANELNDQNICIYAIHPGKLKTNTGSYDADTDPNVAANEIIHKIVEETNKKKLAFMQPGFEEFSW